MKLPATQIESATMQRPKDPRDVARTYLHNVYVDVAAARAIATDGAIAASVPVEVETPDTSGYLTGDAIKAARKLCGARNTTAIGAAFGDPLTLTDGRAFERPTEDTHGRFPDMARILAEPARDVPDVAISVELLMRLAKALSHAPEGYAKGRGYVLGLYFERDRHGKIDPYAPINVRPADGPDGAHGVILPFRWDARR